MVPTFNDIKNNLALFLVSAAIGTGFGVWVSDVALEPKREVRLEDLVETLEAETDDLKAENAIFERQMADQLSQIDDLDELNGDLSEAIAYKEEENAALMRSVNEAEATLTYLRVEHEAAVTQLEDMEELEADLAQRMRLHQHYREYIADLQTELGEFRAAAAQSVEDLTSKIHTAPLEEVRQIVEQSDLGAYKKTVLLTGLAAVIDNPELAAGVRSQIAEALNDL